VKRSIPSLSVKPPPPRVLRKGALVRVAGSEGDVDVEAAAFAFLDLRFAHGHVERIKRANRRRLRR